MNEAGESWPDLAGRMVDGRHRLQVRVYYENTDFSGVVYHADYLKFMERGRSDYLRLIGVHHNELADGIHGEPLGFAVRKMEIDFIKPARIDDVLFVETSFTGSTGARFTLDQRVLRGEDILVTASLTAVVIGPDGRPKRLPGPVRDAFNRQGPGRPAS